MNVTLERISGIRNWLVIYRLYLQAFPAPERKPFSIIRRMHRQGRTDVWQILRDGKFAGFAATVNGDDLILLDYLAVKPADRGRGIGSAAMKLLLAQYHSKGLFVEIESTQNGGPEQQKRRNFYLAAGFRDLGTSAMVFGVPMEMLGIRCSLDFEGYRAFYHDFYSPWAAEHLKPID